MGTEIERKFLVRDESWRREATGSRAIVQGYLAHANGISVRVRVFDDEAAFLTLKSGGSGLSRAEYEYAIPVDDARELLGLAEPHVLRKRRHIVPDGSLSWEIDVFEGRHRGLIVAEVELESEGQAFELPQWLGAEVTGQERYYNTSLAGV